MSKTQTTDSQESLNSHFKMPGMEVGAEWSVHAINSTDALSGAMSVRIELRGPDGFLMQRTLPIKGAEQAAAEKFHFQLIRLLAAAAQAVEWHGFLMHSHPADQGRRASRCREVPFPADPAARGGGQAVEWHPVSGNLPTTEGDCIVADSEGNAACAQWEDHPIDGPCLTGYPKDMDIQWWAELPESPAP